MKYGEVGEEIKEMEVAAGNGVFLPKGLRVKWVWPEPTKYVHVHCTDWWLNRLKR